MTNVAIRGVIKGLLAGLRLTLLFFFFIFAIWTVKWVIGDLPGDLLSALLAFASTRAWFGFCAGASTLLGSAAFGAWHEMGEGGEKAGIGCLTVLAFSFAAGFLVFLIASPYILRPDTDDMSPFPFALIGGGFAVSMGLFAVELIPIMMKAYREGRY